MHRRSIYGAQAATPNECDKSVYHCQSPLVLWGLLPYLQTGKDALAHSFKVAEVAPAYAYREEFSCLGFGSSIATQTP